MSFFIKNVGSPLVPIILNDLGLTVPASATPYDLLTEQPNDIATSTDLAAAISAGSLIVLDPLDGVTELTIAQSLEIVAVHNDPHYRIRGGELDQLDDVSFTGSPIPATDVLQWNGTNWENLSNRAR